nr:reverse transcriptase domain-containing protein [Tanacetum cinerariifolium]
MEELCQPTLNGRGGPITPIAIQATNFGLMNDMIQQVQNSCQFHGLLGDNANKHLDKFLHVTQSIKVNGVTDDALRLYLFPHSLTHHATAWFDRLPWNSINTFEQMEKMFLGKYFPPSMVTKLINEITNFRQRLDVSLFEAWERYKLSIDRGTFMKRRPKECYDLIENMTAHHNDWDTFPPLAKRRTYMLQEPIKVVILTNLKMNTALSSGSRTLPSNTITNPKEDLKGITIRSGNAYKGPTIPTTFSPSKVVEHETDVIKDTVPPTNNESTKDVQPLAVQIEIPIPNSEPVVASVIEPVVGPISASKPNQKPSIPYPSRLHDQKLCDKTNDQKEKFFKIFKDLDFNISFVDALILMPKFVLLKKLPEKLGDPVVDFDVDPRVPLIIEISFLNTGRDLIDVYEGELTLRVGKEAYSQEVFGFSVSGNPTPSTKPIVSNSSPTLTPFGDKFLNDDPSSLPLPPQELKVVKPTNEKSSIDEPPMVELKDLPPHLEYAFLEGDDKLPVIIAKDLKDEEKTALIKKSHFMVKEGIVLDRKISKNRIKVDKAKVDVIAKLPYPTTIKGIRSFLSHADFYQRFIQDFSKIARRMTRLLEKDTSFFLSKECIEAFQTHKRKLTEAPILVAPDWDRPFELMCDASDFAIGAVLGQQKTKHFQPIHYASKTMTDAQAHYTTTEKELLAVVYAFEKFWPYLVLSKSIVYTDHSALKYLFNKQDAKPRLLRWVLLMQEFDITVRDKKRSREPSCRPSFPIREPSSKFGTPHAIISDRGTHFCKDQFAKVMLKYGVTHRLATAYHPQTSGQVEVSNCGLKRFLERTVGKDLASWSDKLDDALWAFRTAFKTPIECTPFKLVYGKACHLPIELEHKAYWALKHCNFDLLTAGGHRKVQLNELNELHDQAYENSLIYKEKTKRSHDSKIKDHVFNVGDRVLLFNSRLKIFSGKLKTHWSGLFTITQVFPYGTVELSQTDGPNFKVNGN